jgi:hypothetical protein
MARKTIVDILCRRDGCNVDKAEQRIDEALERMEEANFDPEECEEIMAEELGLEPDYIIDLLY